jgi:AbrB family looped-hinge helix DNA binding protein
MTSKGQIVIPADIRKEVHAETGTVFAVFGTGDTIVLKKIHKPRKEDFETSWSQLVKESAIKARKKRIKQSDVDKIIHRMRGVKHD